MKLPWRWLLTALLAALPGCGDAPPQNPAPAQPAPATIEGTVHDEKGRPAFKSTVRLYRRFEAGTVSRAPDESGQSTAIAELPSNKAALDGPDMQLIASTECDAQGRFRFADIPAGPILIVAGDARMGTWRQWSTLEAGANQKLEIKLPGRK